jgi:hypothetical protein
MWEGDHIIETRADFLREGMKAQWDEGSGWILLGDNTSCGVAVIPRPIRSTCVWIWNSTWLLCTHTHARTHTHTQHTHIYIYIYILSCHVCEMWLASGPPESARMTEYHYFWLISVFTLFLTQTPGRSCGLKYSSGCEMFEGLIAAVAADLKMK